MIAQKVTAEVEAFPSLKLKPLKSSVMCGGPVQNVLPPELEGFGKLMQKISRAEIENEKTDRRILGPRFVVASLISGLSTLGLLGLAGLIVRVKYGPPEIGDCSSLSCIGRNLSLADLNLRTETLDEIRGTWLNEYAARLHFVNVWIVDFVCLVGLVAGVILGRPYLGERWVRRAGILMVLFVAAAFAVQIFNWEVIDLMSDISN